ncbi:MAG: hypothetical protein ETSY2_54400 [Candidatus Entotheonella gemina]|uniref:IPT/TIG domain-containing protein n=1 Tax=Candidatus Entotheonella gemina TaxID=1429439 RepID=W4L387_9BACT|nr:MAG: hypothetical protein ETSY2_54400 [Candidatus Entotheonella gemina]
MEECSMDNMFFTSSDQCPPPAITSVQPKRGPVQGGTLVTLTGTDLGTKFTDIVEVRLLSNSSSGSDCSLSEEGYVVEGMLCVRLQLLITRTVLSGGECQS